MQAAQAHRIDPARLTSAEAEDMQQRFGLTVGDFEPCVYLRMTHDWMELTVALPDSRSWHPHRQRPHESLHPRTVPGAAHLDRDQTVRDFARSDRTELRCTLNRSDSAAAADSKVCRGKQYLLPSNVATLVDSHSFHARRLSRDPAELLSHFSGMLSWPETSSQSPLRRAVAEAAHSKRSGRSA